MALPLPASAAEPPDRRTWLDEVVTTAHRSTGPAFSSPYIVNVVDLASFTTNRQPRTMTKALEGVPGIMVQKTGHAQGSPYIRGFTGFRNVLLVDGVRFNNSVFRDGPNQYWNLIDPYTIERLEVVKGPSSILYGSDAVGGAVNAILRQPDDYGDGFQWSRQFFTRVSTAERSYALRGEVNATYEGWLGLLVGGTWRDYGDVTGGRFVGKQEWTGYQAPSGDLKSMIGLGQHTTLTIAHYRTRQNDAWRTHKTVKGVSWRGTTVGSEAKRVLDQDWSLTYVRLAAEDLGGLLDGYQVTLSFQEMDERRYRVKSNSTSDRQGFDVDTYGIDAQFESPSPIGDWTYGVEYYHDDVSSFANKYNADGSLKSREIQGPIGDNSTYDLLGVYAQDELAITDRLTVTLGGRYAYAHAKSEAVKDPTTGGRMSVNEHWDTVIGSGRVSYFVDENEHINLFGGVSQGYRAPNLSDLTRLDTARTNEIETASPNVQPEYFLTYEVGAKAKYDNVAAQAAYFITDIKDMIVRTPTGSIIGGDNEVTKKNAGDGYVHGVELEARYRFRPQWTTFGNFTWMYGEVSTYPTSAPVTATEPLDRIMPPTGQIGLRWDHPDERFWLETVCTIAGDADQLSTRDKSDTQRIPPGGTPGYFTFDLRGGWRIRDGIEAWAGLENLTNTAYRIHGSGVNEPGINFIFGLKWKF